MCSLIGYYSFKSVVNEKNQQDIEKGLNLLVNRGPDEKSIVQVSNNCIMGGNRLAIRTKVGVDSMPFKYKHYKAYYNGEIYNFKNWINADKSDGKAVLPLYEKHGTEAFNHLDGEFAISIWDEKEKTLLLVRDHFGTKPVYFSLNEDRLIWASSASAINKVEKHPFCQAVKSPTYKHSFAVQEPYTSFSGIWLIPPGHCLIIKNNSAKLFCYHSWTEEYYNSENTDELFHELDKSLESRLQYNGTIAIPMSAGIDSGIIAFFADKLGIKYQIFSLVEMFGQETEETPYIYERINRLKNYEKVHLLKCNEDEYEDALNEIFLPDYYDSEKFDTGNIPMHTVFKAINTKDIRVAIDGSGGDELFHGYLFRDDFKPVDDFPKYWEKYNYYYSLYTTLLDYTSKTDRAGAHFSIEARYPFQNVKIMELSQKLKVTDELKWALRKYLLELTNYGAPLLADIELKFGFSLKNKAKEDILREIKKSWLETNNLANLPKVKPLSFPFKIGKTS
jgi:asparagine synthase (glutamine-hydrolysing)